MQDFTASAGPQGCPLDELIAFLTARLDEREARALAVLASTARSRESTGLGSTLWDEQDEDARRELREAAAMRAILAKYDRGRRLWNPDNEAWFSPAAEMFGSDMEWLVRMLAAIWSDHQDYQAGW